MKTLRFEDFDGYASAIQDVDIEIKLMRLFARNWQIRQWEVGDIRLQHGQEGSGVLARGAMCNRGWGIYIQNQGTPIRSNADIQDRDSITCMPPGSEFCFAGQGKQEWFSLYIPEDLFDCEGDLPHNSKSAFVAKAGDIASRLRTIIQNTWNASDAQMPLQSYEMATRTFRERVLAALQPVLKPTGDLHSSVQRHPATSRRAVVARAIEIVRDSSDSPLSVSELAKLSGVSEGTLLAAFRREMGVTVQTYLINCRLHEARRALQNADSSETTVAAIAVQFGFFDCGRFAKRYRRLFEELPSRTLESANQ